MSDSNIVYIWPLVRHPKNGSYSITFTELINKRNIFLRFVLVNQVVYKTNLQSRTWLPLPYTTLELMQTNRKHPLPSSLTRSLFQTSSSHLGSVSTGRSTESGYKPNKSRFNFRRPLTCCSMMCSFRQSSRRHDKSQNQQRDSKRYHQLHQTRLRIWKWYSIKSNNLFESKEIYGFLISSTNRWFYHPSFHRSQYGVLQGTFAIFDVRRIMSNSSKTYFSRKP